VASFRSQYGIRLATDLPKMKWREFAAYMSGLDGRTPLGRIVSIRAEDDREVLKQFSPEQARIRNAWRQKKARQMNKDDVRAVIEGFRNMFIGLAGSMTEKPGEDAEKTAEGLTDAEDAETDLS
jgi:hypothetical protein